MRHQDLLVKTIEDLRGKINGGEYELIRACGLLRHLLFDRPTLYELVNESYKVKIVFQVPAYPKDRNHFDYNNFPVEFISLLYKEKSFSFLSKEKFLEMNVIRIREIQYRVRDIIDWGAHIKGGIKSKEAKTDGEKYLLNLDELVILRPLPCYQLIKEICIVTVDALKPLETAIASHTPAANGF